MQLAVTCGYRSPSASIHQQAANGPHLPQSEHNEHRAPVREQYRVLQARQSKRALRETMSEGTPWCLRCRGRHLIKEVQLCGPSAAAHEVRTAAGECPVYKPSNACEVGSRIRTGQWC